MRHAIEVIMNWKDEQGKKIVTVRIESTRIISGTFAGIAMGRDACSTDMYETVLNRTERLNGVRDRVQLRFPGSLDPEFMASADYG